MTVEKQLDWIDRLWKVGIAPSMSVRSIYFIIEWVRRIFVHLGFLAFLVLNN